MRIHKIIFLILMSGVLAATTSCTSKKIDQEDSEISELAGESDGDSESGSAEDDFGSNESSGAEAEDVAAAPAEDAATEDATGTEPEELAGEATSNAEATDVAAGTTDEATDTAIPPEASTADTATVSEPAPEENTSVSAEEAQGLSEPEAPKPMIPLQKVVAAPYKRGSKNINAVYVAREGDTVSSVSMKVFGEDRSAELKKDNPTLARREMKVGDKVYYTSTKRPEDESSMLTYYEDMGLTPEVYLSQPGDNIRTVAQNLLGNKDSWKEIWSLNPDVESKGELPEGTRLRYWPKQEVAVPPVAEASPPQEEAPVDGAAAAGVAEMAPPPMPEEVAPPPMEAAPPPPPPVAEVAPPPPPPAEVAPPAPPQPVASYGAAFGDDPDQLMALGAGAILLLAAVALFIIIRKKRARKNAAIDFQTASHTQIE